MHGDTETQALGTIAAALDGLSCEAQRRVLTYTCDRYDLGHIEPITDGLPREPLDTLIVLPGVLAED